MNCCSQCDGIEDQFDDKTARKDLKRYLRKGPAKSTRILLDALREQGVEGMKLLDIGGGVGIIQHELIGDGIASISDVDGSSSYLAAARSEAEKRGYAEQVDYRHGNFVEIAEGLQTHDIVTLDKVICCFDDMQALVDRSSKLAGKFYAVVYPRDGLINRTVWAIVKFLLSFRKNGFQVFLHPSQTVNALIEKNGLKLKMWKAAGMWQIVVYTRP